MSALVVPPVQPSVLETSQIQLPWIPESSSRLVLSHIGAIARSPHRTDAYDIECAFFEMDDPGFFPLRSSAPLEQLGMLRPGSMFENKRYVGALKELQTKRVPALNPREMCQLNTTGRGEYILESRFPPAATRAIDQAPLVQRWVNSCRDQGRTYYVPSGEIFRFYFGAISLGAASFMSLAVSGADGGGLVDPEQTRFLDDDVLQIAPASGLADRSSALQLAMLLHSPDLMAMWRTTVDQFIADQAWGSLMFYPPIQLPPSEHPFTLQGMRTDVRRGIGGDYERGFLAWSIVSDYRPAPFRRLIIKLPYGMSEVDLQQADEVEDESKARYSNVLPEELKLENRRRPGVAAGRLSHHMESLQRAFPSLAKVQVEYEAPPAPRSPSKRTLPAPEARVIEELSALRPGHDRKVGGIVLRPGAIYQPEAPAQVPTQRLFEEAKFELGEFVPAIAEQTRYPFSTFISAFNLLMRHQAGGLVGQNPISALGAEVMVLKPASDWGSAAGRVIAVGRLDLDMGHVYAFEVSRRRSGERISLGLLAKTDGSAMSWTEISAVGRHAVVQLSLRSAGATSKSRGVWPSPGQFTDVLGRSVKHTRRRRTPAWLAEDLDALGRSLFALSQLQAAA